jgi:exonuclease SbcD
VKLAFFADLHLDAPFRGLPVVAARKRRQALRDALRRIVDLAGDCDALLCGGDLFEQDVLSPDTAAFIRACFASIDPIPVHIAPGNHDWLGPGSIYAQEGWSGNVHVFNEDRPAPVELASGLTLWGAAHRAPANTDNFLEGFRARGDGIHLALIHASEQGWLQFQGEAKAPHAPFRAEQLAEAGFRFAFLGHLHRPRATEHFVYPGNPEALSFGEDGERGAVVAEVRDDGAIRLERHAVAAGGVHDLLVDVTGCASRDAVRELVDAALAGRTGSARVTLTGDLEPDVGLDPRGLDVGEWMDAVVLRVGQVSTRYDLDALRAETTVRGQFVRDVEAADLDEDERRRVIVTGLRALDGRADLEVA